MKFLHTSDWHIGKRIEGRARETEQRQVLAEITQIAECENVDIVLVAGDIYDSYSPSSEAEDLFYNAVTELSGGGKRAVVVIAGNHDDPKRLSAASQLALRHNIYIAGGMDEKFSVSDRKFPVQAIKSESGCLLFSRENQLSAVSFLPYPSDERSGEAVDAEKNYTQKVQGWLNTSLFSKESANIAASHLFLAGSLHTGEERSIEAGGLKAVGCGVFENCHYAALGHIHKRQGCKNALYSGSILQYNFDEKDRKSIELLEITKEGIQSQITLPLTSGKSLKRVEADSVEQAVKALEECKNCYTELTLCLNMPLQYQQTKLLRSSFPDLINLKICFPETQKQVFESRKHLSPDKLFESFYFKKFGKAPEKQLTEYFINTLNQKTE